MKTVKFILCIFLTLASCTLAYGFCPPGGGSPDLNTITGVVKDSSGQPMAKVKARIKDTYMFYITDENGFFIFSNVDKESPTLTFEYRVKEESPDLPESSLKTAVLELGDIGMKKVVFIENITFEDGTAKAKTIHTKDSYDLTRMSARDFEAFQFAGASLEEQVRAFLGIREEK